MHDFSCGGHLGGHREFVGGYVPPSRSYAPVREGGIIDADNVCKLKLIMHKLWLTKDEIQICICTSGVPGIPRQGGQAAASIHFSDGGGGVKVRNMPNFSARFARKVAISHFSRKARGKNENCVLYV